MICKSCEANVKTSEYGYCKLCPKFNEVMNAETVDTTEVQRLINGYTRRFGADDWRVEELKELLG